MPACKETVLPLDSHRVNNRTRSRDLYSDMRCQMVVLRSMGASPNAPAAGSLSNTACLRGRKSVAENPGLKAAAGELKNPVVGGSAIGGVAVGDN